MSIVMREPAFAGSLSVGSDRIPKLAKLFSTTYYDALSAIAAKDGVASSMILLDDGNLGRTRFQGRANGPKAQHAKTVKSVIADLFHGKLIDSEKINAFSRAARSLDGTIIIQETLSPDMVPTGEKAEIKLTGISRSATALITAVALRQLTLP